MFSRALQSIQDTLQPCTFNWIYSKVHCQKRKKNIPEVCQVLFLSSKGLGFFFSLVPQLLFPFLPTNLISCFKHVSPWRRTVLPAAICLSPKHSCGSWHFKNTPWQLVFKTDHFFYFHFLPFPLSQGAEACSQKWILRYFILSSYLPYRLR